jgi:HipA-like protein
MPFKKVMEWLGFRQPLLVSIDVEARFLLKYEDLLVGTLTAHDGKWRFEYSDDFRNNQELRPVIEFPEVQQVYESPELWQFFASRIPSPERAEVEAILQREQIREDDAVTLLKRFGRRTVTNPFELEAVA